MALSLLVELKGSMSLMCVGQILIGVYSVANEYATDICQRIRQHAAFLSFYLSFFFFAGGRGLFE